MTHAYPNSGALFTNNKKTSKNSPDREGSIAIGVDVIQQMVDSVNRGEDVTLRLSGWLKEGKNGPFLSLKAEVQGAWKKAAGQSQAAPKESFDPDDEIPF